MLTMPTLSVLEHAAFVGAGLLVYVAATRASAQRRHPSAAIAWVLAIATFPYLATPLFLLFGSRKFVRPAPTVHLAGAMPSAQVPDWAASLSLALNLPAPVGNATARLHADGTQALTALLALVTQAEHSLEVGTYLLGHDAVGREIADALAAAARRGVRTRLLLDWVGSLKTPRAQLRALREAGVEVRRFMPLLHNPRQGRTNLRNHRKLVVADGAQVWSGGRNLADEYFLDRPGRSAWVDLSFVVEGPVATQALAQFEHDWASASGRNEPIPSTGTSAPAAAGPVMAQWWPSGPDRADDTLHALLMAAAYHARARILAVTPYYVPDEALLEAWCMACRRGVRVSLLLPRRSNHGLADWARERALRRLVECGAQVWLAERMVHAKAVIVDDALALCGSANLDGRSLFLNYEVMTVFYGQPQIDALVLWHAAQLAQATPYRAQRPAWWRDVAEGVVRAVGFQL